MTVVLGFQGAHRVQDKQVRGFSCCSSAGPAVAMPGQGDRGQEGSSGHQGGLCGGRSLWLRTKEWVHTGERDQGGAPGTRVERLE